jgi:NADPH:quinone reductase
VRAVTTDLDAPASGGRVEHQVLPLVAAGRLRVRVAATFPLKDDQAAYDRFRAGGKLGKLVLVT